jgi:hypothetical protein
MELCRSWLSYYSINHSRGQCFANRPPAGLARGKITLPVIISTPDVKAENQARPRLSRNLFLTNRRPWCLLRAVRHDNHVYSEARDAAGSVPTGRDLAPLRRAVWRRGWVSLTETTRFQAKPAIASQSRVFCLEIIRPGSMTGRKTKGKQHEYKPQTGADPVRA